MQHFPFKTFVARHLSRLSIAVIIFFAVSCHNADAPPDVSTIKVSLQSNRLDLDLAAIDTAHIAAGLNELHRKYPEYLDLFLNQILAYNVQFPYVDTVEGIRGYMKSFLSHRDCRSTFDSVRAHYPDTKSTDEAIRKGLQYLYHYDSTYHFDRIIYFQTCLLNWGASTYGSTIGVGLDMFLGPKYPHYAAIEIPQYATLNMETKDIPGAVFKAIYEERHPFDPNDHDLLWMMIEKGKEQYFLKKVLPFVDQHIRLGYSPAQLDWCNKNEAMIYNFFVQQNMLYDKNQQKVVRYVQEGPRASGMPEGSPGSAGIFTGLQIVEAYAKHHPEMKLNELLNAGDEQAILQDAHYNPR